MVLVTLDTTRADHLGAYGYPRPVSPNLDALARDAVLFERAWTTAPWTLPAHASMLTGKHPTSHGAHFDRDAEARLSEVVSGEGMSSIRVGRLGESQVTLAELLADRGYATAAFAGGPWLSPPFGLLQGYAHRDADTSSVEGRPAAELTDAAIAWLRSVPAERPIHLLVNYFDPHSPYRPSPGFFGEVTAVPAPPRPRGPQPLRPALERQIDHWIDSYDGEIRAMDHHLGRLLDALRETGRFEDAMIVVVADHGELFGEHGEFGHGPHHYEGLLHVPLLVRLPGGREAGTRDPRPISVVDLLPWIAAETGLSLPEGVEGVARGTREIVLAELFPDEATIRRLGPDFDRYLITGIAWPWKLTVSEPGAARLFRLDEDPGELRAREAESGAPDLRARLAQARERLVAPETGDAPDGVRPETLDSLRELGYVE